MSRNIIIIGNGIAGITCARHIRKRTNDAITVISSETPHFYSRTALMYIYMGHMTYEHTKPYEDWFWEKNRISLIYDHVTEILVEKKQLLLAGSPPVTYDILVLATGSVNNKPAIEGITLKGIQTLYGIPDLESMEAQTKDTKHAIIIGGGLIGIEMAEMLHSRKIPVSLLIREQRYWDNVLPVQEAEMISAHIKNHGIDLQESTEVVAITGNEAGKVNGVVTKDNKIIGGDFVGLTIGVSPNIELVKNTAVETGKGILVNKFFETSVPGIYAIGDCVEHRHPPPGRKAVEQVWYTGRIHGETLALIITGQRVPYDPGPWFNSAKFFDIEYQTYGHVPNTLASDVASFYWQHPDEHISFRVVFDKNTEAVKGFNALGMRLRHAVCEKILQQALPVDDVMANLHQLNFNAEFETRFESDIVSAYNTQMNRRVQLKKRSKFAALNYF